MGYEERNHAFKIVRQSLGFPSSSVVKNPPAMQVTWVRSLGWEDPLEKGSHLLQYSGLENSMDCTVHGVAKSQTRLSDFHLKGGWILEKSISNSPQ